MRDVLKKPKKANPDEVQKIVSEFQVSATSVWLLELETSIKKEGQEGGGACICEIFGVKFFPYSHNTREGLKKFQNIREGLLCQFQLRISF